MKHARLKMYGVAFNVVTGSWLLKAETAYFRGLTFFNFGYSKYSRTDVLAGIEYSGFDDTTISLETVNRHINNFENILKQYPDEAVKDDFQSYFRVRRAFLNEKLILTSVASLYGLTGQDGAYKRINIEYKITDPIKMTNGVIFYHARDQKKKKKIGNNDRYFFEIKYSF